MTLEDAREFLEDAYDRRARRSGRTVEHPVAVARLLAADGQAPTVVLAGLLHDVLEDTDVSAGELIDRFGPDVTEIVVAVTQDDGIADYEARKEALRRQTVAGGREAATVALADKLSKVADPDAAPRPRRLSHYRATLEAVEDAYGPSDLSRRLREQLDRWP